MMMDFVGKFENIESDFAEISKALCLVGSSFPKLNVSTDRKTTESYYDLRLKEFVRKQLAADFERFGY